MADKPELFLVDGNSLAYRAFFALPESIATHDGRPTNAIFGLASMLAKIVTEYDPKALVVAWDAGWSGREKVYKEYKAGRESRPDLLREQWPAFEPLVEAFGFHNIRAEGYEADDVIATIARQARDAGAEVMVVSGDRDVYQLVGDGIRVMSTGRGITDTKVYDRQAVLDRYGVPPELITDMMGLRGDTSDNIPGVPGIGEKTASALLGEFGTLEGVLESIEKISGPKRKQNLTEHADDARLSKQLATLDDGVEFDLDLDAILAASPDRRTLRDFAAEYELRAVIERLEDGGGELPRGGDGGVEVEAGAGEIADLGGKAVALAAVAGGWAAADANDVVTGEVSNLGELAGAIGARRLVAHDAKSLWSTHRGGLLGAEPRIEIEHDTMVAAYLLDAARRNYDLVELAAEEGVTIARPDAGKGDGEDPAQLALDAEVDPVAELAERARLTWELYERQRPRLAELGLEPLLGDVELPLIRVLAAMEEVGLLVDIEKLNRITEGLAERIDALQSEIWRECGSEFTIGSPQQLAKVLFEDLGLPPKRRGKTGYSTDARVLAQIRDRHPAIPKIESWRELSKLKSTYLDALPRYVDSGTGRIHTTFIQVGASTGRLASTEPNLQNIPVRSEEGRPIRGCFVAREGCRLVALDYNQVELRVLAHVAGEDALREIFASGEDVHTATAAEVLEIEPGDVGPAERSKAKMVNYGIVYGLSAFGLSDRLGIDTGEAAEYINRYFSRFPAVRAFIDKTIQQALERGFVTTLLGRRRNIGELRARNPQTRSLGERLAVNTVVQGTAADIIKIAMVNCHAALGDAGLESRLVLQIHDELLFECPETEIDAVTELATELMVGAFELDPPLAVDVGVGANWLEAK